MTATRKSFVLAALVGLACPLWASDSWPAFRGGGGNATHAKNLPVTWSEKENIAWKVALPGHGQSSPVVWKDRVFVTAVDGLERDNGFVQAFDAVSGKRLWSHEFAPTQKAKWSTMISRAAPTPLVDADAVYAFFEGGDVIALTHDGKPLWSRSLVKDYGEFKNGHGLGSSLAGAKDAVLVLIDHGGPSYLAALSKRDGKTLWKTDRKSRSSWSSPIVVDWKDRTLVIVSSNGSVAGYDAASGGLLWEMTGIEGNTIPSASALGDQILVGAGVGRGGGDPKTAARSNCCLQLVDDRGKPSYRLVWQAAKATSSFATPLAHRGHAYFVNQVGVVFCIDLASGKERYAERLESPCWASPLGAGDHVYFFGKDGQTTVLKAGPVFERVAANRLEAPAAAEEKKGDPAKEAGPAYSRDDATLLVYGVAAVDGAFLVRTGTALYRIANRTTFPR